MANEWYIQQGPKQFGPLSSAQLKKLASEGKIAPNTNVRRGSDSAWVPASRVQGLFAPAKAASPAPSAARGPLDDPLSPPPAPPPVKARPPAPPPMAVPLATPVASPLRGSFGSPPKAQPVASSMRAKIIGGVALMLGALALAVFWLPVFGAMGWLGIGVGALGLLLGIAGLVISAMDGGSGLYLNFAGAGSSLVGLVLTVVFGVLYGMFGKAAPVQVAIPATVQPPATPPPAAAPVVPEPEPEPEIVWTKSSEAIAQGPIKASIASAAVESVRFERDLLSGKAVKPQNMLRIRVTVENISADKIVECPLWPGSSAGLVGGDVSRLLEGSELGKAVQAAEPAGILVDNVGNPYKQTPAVSLFKSKPLAQDPSLRPGEKREAELVFPPPLDSIEFLRLELPAAGFSGSEPLRFEIAAQTVARGDSK